MQFLVGDAFFLRPIFDRQIEVEHPLDFLVQTFRVPLLRIGVLRHMLRHKIVDDGMAHVGDDFRHIVLHPFDALIEDNLALIVHHVVELQKVLADVEVARLDLLLRLFERLVDPGMNDRLVLFQSKLLQHAVELVGPEDPHQVVFEREKELGMTRIALAARTTAQLVVDAAAFMALRAEHEKPAGGERFFLQPRNLRADFIGARRLLPLAVVFNIGDFLADAHIGVTAELNVGAAARHVGRNRDRARNAGLRDDVGFLFVIACIEDSEDLRPGRTLIA
jgi:hypothetical protein